VKGDWPKNLRIINEQSPDLKMASMSRCNTLHFSTHGTKNMCTFVQVEYDERK